MSLVAFLVGAIAVFPGAALPAQAATAAVTTDSALTVAWNGDTSSAREFQPERQTSSAHFNDFKDLSVTVSQTTGIIDQAIRVSVSGFAGTRSFSNDGTMVTNAQNFVQAMQCWGDPAAEDFRETCQWGGRGLAGFGSIVVPDNTFRVGPDAWQPDATNVTDVPFKPRGGGSVTGRIVRVDGKDTYPLLEEIGAATTNEVTAARVGNDGTGYFDFEAQTSIQAPQLGCGSDGNNRCWLVIVPRGTHFGGGTSCSSFRDPGNNYAPYTKGRAGSVQGGSPISDQCDYWDNRVVVPLDFQPTSASCPTGSKEKGVIGSQLMISAMISWQPALCQSTSVTYSFATNPDSVARAQVIAEGAGPKIAYTGYPVSPGELLNEDERNQLAKTTLVYAPVGVSSVVVGFFAEGANGRVEQLNLSPRLVAKLLTQSYKFTVPSNSSDVRRPFAHLGEVNRSYNYLNQDPEFRELNPDNYAQFSNNPAIVLPGPSGADAIKQVWRWIVADADARAFLAGEPDDWGMTVNPYYLPKGNPGATIPWYLDANGADLGENPVTREVGLTNLDGSPRSLSDVVLDSFPKNDESLVPLHLGLEKSRFGSIQFAPYSENLLSGARQSFRGTPNSKTVWDATKLNSAGETGDWVSSGTQLPGDKFMITITDSPSAHRYSLSMASLKVPNSDEIVAPGNDGMSAALSALAPTTLDTVKQVDPGKVSGGGYPMTIVTYAAVNVSGSDSESREKYAAMITEVTTKGQVTGTSIGQLPNGYLPLTRDLVAEAQAAVSAIRAFGAPVPPAAGGTSVKSSTTTTTKSTTPSTSTTPTTTKDEQVAAVPEFQDSDNRTAATSAIASGALVIALVIGFLGFLIGPFLFRGLP